MPSKVESSKINIRSVLEVPMNIRWLFLFEDGKINEEGGVKGDFAPN